MGIIVSSRYHFLEQHPEAKLSFAEVEHELKHLKRRERVSALVAVGAVALSMISLVGIIGGGLFVLGALLAIAAVAAGYAYCCREAESGLRGKQIRWYAKESEKEPTVIDQIKDQVNKAFN